MIKEFRLLIVAILILWAFRITPESEFKKEFAIFLSKS